MVPRLQPDRLRQRGLQPRATGDGELRRLEPLPGRPSRTTPGSNNFDGNPDWAPDGSPDCPDGDALDEAGQAGHDRARVRRHRPRLRAVRPQRVRRQRRRPEARHLSNSHPTDNPSTVDYTPDPGFSRQGPDHLRGLRRFRVRDRQGQDRDQRSDSIAPAETSTIGGTPARTSCAARTDNDVIAAGGGNDKINGRRRQGRRLLGGRRRSSQRRRRQRPAPGRRRQRQAEGRGRPRQVQRWLRERRGQLREALTASAVGATAAPARLSRRSGPSRLGA